MADGMPIEFILEYVIKGLEGYGVTEQYIRKILKKSEYEIIEESTMQIRNNSESFEFDDNNPSEQTTVTVAGSGGGKEPEESLPPIKAVKKLQEKLTEVTDNLKQKD